MPQICLRYAIFMWPIHCAAVRVVSNRRQTGEDMFREGPVLDVHIHHVPTFPNGH